jgi:hypothetical protein
METDSTFQEYVRKQTLSRCRAPHDGVTFRLNLEPPKTEGKCDDFKFLPPYYDVAATVREVETLNQRYLSADAPLAGKTAAERTENLKKAVANTLASIETNLQLAYEHTYCKFQRTSNCAGHTGQKKICDRIYVTPPAYQVFTPGSLIAGRHVKESQILEPRLAYFRVGVTGHGENFGTITIQSQFDSPGAKEKASLDVDKIRAELIRRKLPTDRPPKPPPAPPKAAPSPPTKVSPTRPARFRVECLPNPKNGDLFGIMITNTGAAAGRIKVTVWRVDGFFAEPRTTVAATIDIGLEGGETWMPEAEYNNTRTVSWSAQVNEAIDISSGNQAVFTFAGRCR